MREDPGVATVSRSMRLGLLGAFAVGFFLVLAPAAQAEKRVALVIGTGFRIACSRRAQAR